MRILDGSLVDVTIDAAFQLDPLSAVMVSFVTFVGFLIHLYSVGYMHDEPDRAYSRYFGYLNLFMFSMLTLILGSNLPVLFVGWEGVGLCSYLLIGFWYTKRAPALASKKAFLVNRVADHGFLIGIMGVFLITGTMNLLVSFELFEAEWWVEDVVILLLFVGAAGKSAQFPFHVWLPDAMAGPTPVSALIRRRPQREQTHRNKRRGQAKSLPVAKALMLPLKQLM